MSVSYLQIKKTIHLLLEQPACKKRYLERLSLKTQRQRFFRRLLDESSLQVDPTAKMAIGRNI